MKSIKGLSLVMILAFITVLSSCGGNSRYEVRSEVRYLNPVFDKVDITKDIEYADIASEEEENEKLLDIYQPEGDGDTGRKLVILVHGGGFSSGDKNEMADLATVLAKRGYVAVSMNYSLANLSSFNKQTLMMETTNDVAEVVNWLKENSRKYGLDTKQIAIGGVSAGACISLEAAMNSALYGSGIKFFAVIDMYGSLETQIPTPDSPPVLMIHGDRDATVPIASSYYLKDLLDSSKVYNELYVMKGAGHGIPVKYFEEAVLKISEFLYRTSELKKKSGLVCAGKQASVVPGESFRVELRKTGESKKSKLKICMPEEFKIKEGSYSEKSNGNLAFEVTVPDSGNVIGNHLIVFEAVGDKPAANKALMQVKVVDPVAVSIGSRLVEGNPEVLQEYFTIKNSSGTKAYSGSIAVKGYNSKKQNFIFSGLKPGESREYKLSGDTYGYCGFTVKLDGGFEKEYTEGVFAAGAVKVNTPPKIDGKLDEWMKEPSFTLEDKSQIKLMKDWGGPGDLSSSVRLGWDEKNFYLAAIVKDNKHVQEFAFNDIWNGDSIQFSLDRQRTAKPGSEGTDEFGYALGNEGVVYGWRWIVSDGHAIGPIDFGKSAVKRVGKDTVYEIAIPWKEILGEGRKPEKGMHLGFSYLVNDNDGGARRGWMEFSGGIGGNSKDPYAFGDLFLK